MLLFWLFFASGATALIYEVIWSKSLTLMFGSTVYAQTIVLAVFMAGLALGNMVFGRQADRWRQPLKVYGYLELGLGLYATFFPDLYRIADQIFIGLGRHWIDSETGLILLKAVLSVGLLLGPTLLMGGTLPIIAAWLQRRPTDPGRLTSRFYSVNSLGAALGAGLAGFYLVQTFGMTVSLRLAAMGNGLIGLTALAYTLRQPVLISRQTPDPLPAPAPAQADIDLAGNPTALACVLVAFTGGISMGLEILAARGLALMVGGSLQAFTIVLMAFIFGIGAGSALVASPRFDRGQRAETVSALLLGGGVSVGLVCVGIKAVAFIYLTAKSGLAANATGYLYHETLIGLIAIFILGLPAALLGAAVPLAIRLTANTTALGNRVGRLLSWNTWGAVAGVLLTGFAIMPAFGLRGALGAFSLLLLAMAGLWAAWHRHPKIALLSAGLCVATLVSLLLTGQNWRYVMGAGIFRLRAGEMVWDAVKSRPEFIKIMFYEDAPDATVMIETTAHRPSDEFVLRINGKPDASIQGDLSTQLLLAHLPMMARPDSKDVFVLGFGSGITAGALLTHPITNLVLAENCAPVLRASKFFEGANRKPLADARTRLWSGDARTYLKLSESLFDLIISEPSNPWAVGNGSVFSREFYELAASRLKAGGVMAQWFHTYEMHDEIVNMVLRTFVSVFPQMEIWDSEDGDIILLGSKQSWRSGLENIQRVFERAAAREDLLRIGLKKPQTLFLRQLASQRTAFAIPGNGRVQSDEFPILEYAAPKAFFIGAVAKSLFLFDERTWQSSLAPPEKQQALLSLSEHEVSSTFTNRSSSNIDFIKYLSWRQLAWPTHGTNAVYPDGPFFPVIVRPPSSFPTVPSQPKVVTRETLDLAFAEVLVYQTNHWREGVEKIESILKARQTAHPKLPSEWVPGYFAALAARARFDHDDLLGARISVALGLELDPEDDQLLYLRRVLERIPDFVVPGP